MSPPAIRRGGARCCPHPATLKRRHPNPDTARRRVATGEVDLALAWAPPAALAAFDAALAALRTEVGSIVVSAAP
jgi:hypothetical protein